MLWLTSIVSNRRIRYWVVSRFAKWVVQDGLLITADMAKNNLGRLTIHSDMDIVFELIKSKFVLPLNLKDAKAPAMRRVLINKLGCKNPAGVEMLLNINAAEL